MSLNRIYLNSENGLLCQEGKRGRIWSALNNSTLLTVSRVKVVWVYLTFAKGPPVIQCYLILEVKRERRPYVTRSKKKISV